MFSVVGFSHQSAGCIIFVHVVPEANFKEDFRGEGRDKEVGLSSLEMSE